MSWLLLSCAIASEVGGTLSLRVAATGRRAFYGVVAGGYLMAFVFLSASLAMGMPLGVAYGIWTAVGIVLTVLLSKLLFGESLTAVMGLGIALIVGGVLLIELGAAV
ncbi:MAG TPA: QacE family quaternary ammonium compound efflux SMR transporter [Candidatus Brachybacterium merdavium]|uniref:Spermidine export protein MdtJ n=1 Tax=Candidatus Brachybacterium merdavium TaxID=2838513 RepID=A0A9D2LG77_9MICO|nr:QacE family quaternary ammonium compound efflux SMR transporter [Candidatus Brachybacterium merdavium]